MKKNILLLLVAVFTVATMGAQETRKAIYVIDGKQVENFDGSQLVGKTINNYSIDSERNLHSIITSDLITREIKSGESNDPFTRFFPFLSTQKEITRVIKSGESVNTGVSTDKIYAKAYEVVYVLDGKIVPYSEIESLSSSRIDNMTVIKDKGSSVFMKYAKEYKKSSKTEPKCVILITTKK